jgi:hypothetical protein
MRFTIRIEIHDKEYARLHERAEAIGLSRTITNPCSGKEEHLPIGTYVTDTYSSARMAMLAAKGAAIGVDPRAEIVVSGGNEFLTSGLREIEGGWSSIFRDLDLNQSTFPVPSFGLHSFALGDSGNQTIPGSGKDCDSTAFWTLLG